MDRRYLRLKLLTMQMTRIPHIRKIHRYDGQSAMTTKIRKSISYHHEGVANPERIPSLRTVGNLDGLTVNCNHHSRSFTYCTSGEGKGGEHSLHSEYMGNLSPSSLEAFLVQKPIKVSSVFKKQD